MIDLSDHARVIEERNELGRQNDRYEKALREIVSLMADREKFVLMGLRAMAPIERIATAALTGSVARDE